MSTIAPDTVQNSGTNSDAGSATTGTTAGATTGVVIPVAVLPAPPPPTPLAIPAGFTPPAPGRAGGGTRGPKGVRPLAKQVSDARLMAQEIAASPDFATQFGPKAPAAAVLVQQLLYAAGWSQAVANARVYLAYCIAQDAKVWPVTLDATAVFKKVFELATADDLALASLYPHTRDFLDARNVLARAGAQTRATKKRAAAKSAAAAKASTAGSAPAASAVPPAPVPKPAPG